MSSFGNDALEKSGILISQRRDSEGDHINFVEETGRNEIYEWSQIREEKNRKIWNRLKIYYINFAVISLKYCSIL